MKTPYLCTFGVLLLLAVFLNPSSAQHNSPACKFDSILPTGPMLQWSPDGKHFLINRPDTAGVYQIYVGTKGSTDTACISAKDTTGNYPLASCWWWVRHWDKRNKMQVRWSPSGKWIMADVERECYQELTYTPYSLLLTLLETGWKMDMWATNLNGSNWIQLADSVSALGNGVVGPVFTPDGTKAAWAQLQDSSKPTDKFGYWQMMLSEVIDTGTAAITFVKTKNINPPGARWIEPGNFSPDGKLLMISSDIGLKDAQGQDQYVFNIYAGTTINLTNSPKIWDEHGVFSPDGKKIIFMSSFPYKADTNSYHTLSLKTEFMLIDASVIGSDSAYYPGYEQLTHFNVTGYPEYAGTGGAVAAAGAWSPDGSEFFCQDLLAPNYGNWMIRFSGDCGYNSAAGVRAYAKQGSVANLFPNPTTGRFTIESQSSAKQTLQILDMTGKLLFIQTLSSPASILDVQDLLPGVYTVCISDSGNRTMQRLVIVR